MADASAPTGEVVAGLSLIGGWKPITAYSLRRHSGSLLSGRPPSEPFSFLKRATRFIISARVQVRMFFQASIGRGPLLRAGVIMQNALRNAVGHHLTQPDSL